MKKSIYLLAIILLAACGTEHKDSEELKEAKIIQEAIDKLQEQVEHRIHEKMDDTSIKLEEAIASSDSITSAKMQEAENSLHTMHDALDEWRESLLEIPDDNHSHEECDHDHSHDAAKEKLLEGLSDAEILEIQKELKQNLDEISEKIDSILKD